LACQFKLGSTFISLVWWHRRKVLRVPQNDLIPPIVHHVLCFLSAKMSAQKYTNSNVHVSQTIMRPEIAESELE